MPARMSASRMVSILAGTYRDGGVTLRFSSPFELLVATVLSAQCTDERVNAVTPGLFRKYPDARHLAQAPLDDVRKIVHPLGFFNQKSRAIIALSARLVEHCGGDVPADRTMLESLPGVGRKTANIVLSRVFGIPAIAVDTHVFRVASRMFGFERLGRDQVEQRLMELLPEKDWNLVNHTLIFHGRSCCSPRKPGCDRCPVAAGCAYARSCMRTTAV